MNNEEVVKEFAENVLKSICASCPYLTGTECHQECPGLISQHFVVNTINNMLKKEGVK